MKKVDRQIDIDVIMSVQNQKNLYFELTELTSITVGDGSHFGPGAYCFFAASLVASADSPAQRLNEILPLYQQALKELGY